MRQHGTYAKYKLDNCRCYPCAAKTSEYNTARERAIAYGTWQPFVDAEPVRAHVTVLRECGIGLRQLSALTGLSRSVLTGLMNGKPGKPPAKRVRPATAQKILAVEPTLANIAPSTPVDAAGTHRRIQALVFNGWSQAKLANRLGMTPGNFTTFMKATQVTARHALAARALYRELGGQAPPEAHYRDKIAATRARNHARAAGWLPPAAWDDDLIDLPQSELDAELARQVAAMDDDELHRCHTAARDHGERSPLIRAAARAWARKKTAAKRAQVAA